MSCYRLSGLLGKTSSRQVISMLLGPSKVNLACQPCVPDGLGYHLRGNCNRSDYGLFRSVNLSANRSLFTSNSLLTFGSPPKEPEKGEAGDQQQQQPAAGDNEMKKEIESLTEKIREIDDKYKRALAEAENTRVRMRRQVDDAKVFGIQGFCKDLLEVADILQAAIKSVPLDQLKDEHCKSLFKGVEMTEKSLQTVFRRHGLNIINPIGAKFDPNEHHAMFEAEDPSKEPGTVSVVTQIGYKLQDRTIRPAMVGVVKSRS